MARVTIFGHTLARVSYIAANLRDQDVDEFVANFGQRDQMADMLTNVSVASGPNAFVACVDDTPALAFGVLVLADLPHIGHAYGFGTDKAWRTIPTVSHFIRTGLIPQLLDAGVNRVEVRVKADIKSSVHWLANHMGAQFETDLPEAGFRGETFKQFSWTRKQFLNVLRPQDQKLVQHDDGRDDRNNAAA